MRFHGRKIVSKDDLFGVGHCCPEFENVIRIDKRENSRPVPCLGWTDAACLLLTRRHALGGRAPVLGVDGSVPISSHELCSSG